MNSASRQELQAVVSQARLDWAAAFGQEPSGDMLDAQVEEVVRSVQLTKAIGQHAAGFGELLLGTLTQYTSEPISDESRAKLDAFSAQDLDAMLRTVAWKLVHDVVSGVDAAPPMEEEEVPIVDLDIELPPLPGSTGETT